MKKFIFGCTLLLAGIIGFVGWMNACVNKIGPGARTEVIGCFNGTDELFAIVFVVMALTGLVITIIELRKEK